MLQIEADYIELVKRVLSSGDKRITRNGEVLSVFGATLAFEGLPLLQGRRINVDAALGEWAALVRQPKTLKDFERYKCNYWKKWAKPDGSISLDYGNNWFKFGQVEHVKHCLKNDPTNRRMIITGWNPENLDSLDLPCCHHTYQFYVGEDNKVQLLWQQRSLDLMVGLPFDLLLAWLMVETMSNEAGLEAGKVTMCFGDVHIYASHVENAYKYLANSIDCSTVEPKAIWVNRRPFEEFEPSDVFIDYYVHQPSINFEVVA